MIDSLCGWGAFWVSVLNVGCATFVLVKTEIDRRKEDKQERRINKLCKKVKALRAELAEKENELRHAKSEVATVKHLVSAEYGAENARLRGELDESNRQRKLLETMLEQKWQAANGGES